MCERAEVLSRILHTSKCVVVGLTGLAVSQVGGVSACRLVSIASQQPICRLRHINAITHSQKKSTLSSLFKVFTDFESATHVLPFLMTQSVVAPHEMLMQGRRGRWFPFASVKLVQSRNGSEERLTSKRKTLAIVSQGKVNDKGQKNGL